MGDTIMLNGTSEPCHVLEWRLVASRGGTNVPSNMGWSCQITRMVLAIYVKDLWETKEGIGGRSMFRLFLGFFYGLTKEY